MARKDGTGPPKNSKGLRDGSGKGKGRFAKTTKKGSGKKTGGKKGSC